MKKAMIRLVLSSFIICLLALLSACTMGGGTDTPTPAKEERYGVPEEVNASVVLPEEYEGATIAWSSSNEKVLNSQGWLFMPEEDTEVVLTATIYQNGTTKTKEIKVNVVPSKKDPFTVAYKTYEGKVSSLYYKNGSFTYIQYKTYEATFTSMNPDVITNEGIIIQTDHDQEAIIEIKIRNTDGGEVRTYYKKTTIKEYSNDTYASIIGEWVDEEVASFKAGRLAKLPTEHVKYPSTITWNSGKNIVVTDDGTVIKPIDAVNDTISCQIRYNDTVIEKKYQLENYGGNTTEGFLDQWLPYIMPKKLTTHKNYVEWISNDYYFHHQIEIYTGGVLNLIDGKALTINQDYYCDINNASYKNRVWYSYSGRFVHPSFKANATESEIANEGNNSNYVTQAYLDQAFYPGYQITNPENVLWVVVHESGMARPGEDALCLAQSQWRNVYETSTPRDASWHYQVDEGIIYQSFPDTAGCWHAGGTHPTSLHPHCNSSSIGIEMCINADGNYDGSMHHDTKLVANLCYKYNLNVDNIKRHYDMSGKECPAYMIRTSRWNQFLEWTNIELNAIKYLRDAQVTWTVSNLDTLFTKGPNGLYYAKAVTEVTDVEITLDVVKGDYHFNRTVTLKLYPDTVDLSQWIWTN